MKRSGMRSGFAVAFDAMSIAWYPGLRATIRGFGKNMVGGVVGYRVVPLLVMAVGCVFLAVGPLLILFSSGVRYVRHQTDRRTEHPCKVSPTSCRRAGLIAAPAPCWPFSVIRFAVDTTD